MDSNNTSVPRWGRHARNTLTHLKRKLHTLHPVSSGYGGWPPNGGEKKSNVMGAHNDTIIAHSGRTRSLIPDSSRIGYRDWVYTQQKFSRSCEAAPCVRQRVYTEKNRHSESVPRSSGGLHLDPNYTPVPSGGQYARETHKRLVGGGG